MEKRNSIQFRLPFKNMHLIIYFNVTHLQKCDPPTNAGNTLELYLDCEEFDVLQFQGLKKT